MFKQRVRWLARLWPFWWLVIVVLIYLSVIYFVGAFHVLGLNTTMTNKIVAAVLQVGGGLIVLQSVNDNLGIHRGNSLVGLFIEFLRSFPIRPRTIIVSADASMGMSFSGTGAVTSASAAVTIEERLACLELQVKDVHRTAIAHHNQSIAEFARVRSELSNSSETNRSLIRSVEQRIDQTVVGGFKMQLFGVGLLALGAFVSVYT